MDGEMISKAIEPLDQFAARLPAPSPFVLVQPSRQTLATCRESERASDQECQLCVNNPPLLWRIGGTAQRRSSSAGWLIKGALKVSRERGCPLR